MADSDLLTFLSRVRRLAADVVGASDAQLLDRFATSQDEAAFELLVWRHARLVFGVCRRVLHDVHDAEDAFQATFLALARRASRIKRREAVAGWLYQVAYRAALTARDKRVRKASRERLLLNSDETAAPPNADTPAEREELRAVLDQEVSRLPARFRAPVVLCYFEGKTVDEAARQLGCPRGTVASRLARARQRLRVRLDRRGLGLAAALSAITQIGAAPRPLSLIPALIPAALRIAAGGGVAIDSVSPQVASLTEEVLKAMFLHKLKTGTAVLVTIVGLLLAGGGLGVHLYANAQNGEPPTVVEEQQPAPAAPEKEKPRDEPPAAQPRSVTVVRPVQRDVAPFADFVGRLEAGRTFEVPASANGRLERCLFQAGAGVKKGELLFEIDPTGYRLALDKATAELEGAEARRKQSSAEAQRFRQLQKQERAAVRQDEVEKAEANLEVAEAACKAARAEVARARLNLEGTQIRAPADGQISRPLVDPGNVVSGAGERATLLATITSLDPIGLNFDVDERSYLRYRRLPPEQTKGATSLQVRLAADDRISRAGTLTGFDDRIDPRDGTSRGGRVVRTGSIRARGVLTNRDRLLLPGMSVRVLMTFGPPSPKLIVPQLAVRGNRGYFMLNEQDRAYVLIVNEHNRLERREVNVLQFDEGMWHLEKGLRPDNWVVVGGPKDLKPGDLVQPQRNAPTEDDKARSKEKE